MFTVKTFWKTQKSRKKKIKITHNLRTKENENLHFPIVVFCGNMFS